jgi:hypothetical protein
VGRNLLTVGATALAGVTLVLGAGDAAAKTRRPAPWATVNVCDTSVQPHRLGVRAFVPRRGVAAQWARIRVQFFDDVTGSWKRVTADADDVWQKLGSGRASRFGGRNFELTPPDAGHRFLLRGVVDIQWRRGGEVVARDRVLTTAGHANLKDPELQDSRAVCEMRG